MWPSAEGRGLALVALVLLLWVTVAVGDHARIPLEFSLPSQTMAASAAVAFMHVASEDAVTHAVFL
jgi:hypothetical protein